MMIKYCAFCAQRPYTKNLSTTFCPTCSQLLQAEMVQEESLLGRPLLPVIRDDDWFQDSVPQMMPFEQSEYTENVFEQPNQQDPFQFHEQRTQTPKTEVQPCSENFPNRQDIENGEIAMLSKDKQTPVVLANKVIRGKVSQYSSSGREDGAYRRLFVSKIIEAVFYRQRLEDVLHRFNVRIDNGRDAMGYSQYLDIPVNVHGTIAGGMQITDNAEVEVEGKYKNGVLMASKVTVVNNGYRSQIKFQRSISAIIYGILAAVATIALIAFVANTDGSFFANLKSFLITWLVVSVVTTVLYLVLIFSKIGFLTRMATGKPKKFPIIGILLFSLIVTMVFLNLFGLGATLGGLFSRLLSAIMPAAIVIIVIIVLIKLIFK